MADAPSITPKPPPGELPTAADVTYLSTHPAPGPAGKNVSDDLAYLFTPHVVAQLTSPVAAAFFGEALRADTLAEQAARATAAAAVRDRLDAGREAAKQLYVASASPLDARMHAIMARWPEFAAAHPTEANALAQIRIDWLEHHKPGGHRKDSGKPEKSDTKSDETKPTK